VHRFDGSNRHFFDSRYRYLAIFATAMSVLVAVMLLL
jgi:hypothetical protein